MRSVRFLLLHSRIFLRNCDAARSFASAATTANSPALNMKRKASESSAATERKNRLKSVGKALEFYLDKLQQHEQKMMLETELFESGKRHLANIMGWPAHMKIEQKDIDMAVQYLFPSGLTDPKATPVFKPPEEIFPKFKKMEFDSECRPKDPLFYTTQPRFYHLLSDVNEKTLRLVHFHDQMVLKGSLKPNAKEGANQEDNENNPHKLRTTLSGSQWKSIDTLKVKLQENINESQYASLIMALDYMASLPFSYFYEEFIMEYRDKLLGGGNEDKSMHKKIFGVRVPTPKIDPITLRRYAVARGKNKGTYAEVKVTDSGTGQFFVDGHHYSKFRFLTSRETFMCPLIITDLLGKVDVDAMIVEGTGGTSAVPKAVRHGTSVAVAALFPEYREMLRIAGLLTLDIRKKERSKINQPGARAKWIWKKR